MVHGTIYEIFFPLSKMTVMNLYFKSFIYFKFNTFLRYFPGNTRSKWRLTEFRKCLHLFLKALHHLIDGPKNNPWGQVRWQRDTGPVLSLWRGGQGRVRLQRQKKCGTKTGICLLGLWIWTLVKSEKIYLYSYISLLKFTVIHSFTKQKDCPNSVCWLIFVIILLG